MDHFTYWDGELYAEDVALRELADRIGTPFFCYSTATLERHYRVFAEAVAGLDARICYAVKANSNVAVIALLASCEMHQQRESKTAIMRIPDGTYCVSL